MAGNAMAIAKAEALQGAVLKRFEEERREGGTLLRRDAEGASTSHQEGDGAPVRREPDVQEGLRLDDGVPGGAHALEGEGLPAAQLADENVYATQ